MSDSVIMSQRERTAKHRATHPESEAVRKERQRNKEAICMFHIKRFMISGIEIPESIDQGSAPFERALGKFEALRNEKVITEITS